MAIEAKEMIVSIRKVLIFSIRTSFKFSCDHPFVLGAVFFLLLVYRSFPSLFALFVSSSPIIICTALLLGTLLSFGEPNIPEIEEEEKTTQEISSLKVRSVADDLVVKKDESLTLETHEENRRDFKEMLNKEAALGEGRAIMGSRAERDALLATTHNDGEEEEYTTMAVNSMVEEDKEEIHSEKQVTEEREVHDPGFIAKGEFSVEKLSEAVLEVDEDGDVSIKGQREIEGLKVEINKPALENRFESSLGSPWHPIDIHDASSDYESDRAESSSPDASMADIIPMLDELHPLLGSEPPHPALISVNNSDSASSESAQDHESDDDSGEEEVENQEEEEVQEEKDAGTEVVVTWTADDQKNLMDLGTSELERNQRLENLIAKRRARRNQRIEAEKNLIDLDSNDSVPIMEELSRLHIALVSTTRRNPFDYDSEETVGLPPIPGSAPSVLLPVRNPFDLPYDQADDSANLTGENLSHEDFLPVQQGDIFFRRYESFSLGGSSVELKQERRDFNLRPFFATERMDLETGFTSFQRQLTEKSDSKASSVPEYDPVSSLVDQEYHKGLAGDERHQESELISPGNRDAEPVEQGIQSCNVDSVDAEQEQNRIDACGDHSIDLTTSNVIEETRQVADAFGGVEEDIKNEVELTSPTSDDLSSSSTASEVNEKESNMNVGEESPNFQQTKGDSDGSCGSVGLVLADSDLLSKVVDDCQVEEPVYDSSPSAIEKTLSNLATLDEDLFYADNGSFSSTSFLASDMQAGTLEMDLPARPVEKDVFSGEEDCVSRSGSTREELASGNGGLCVTSSNLSSVEENESRSNEVIEIREHDVVQIGFSDGFENFNNQDASVIPEPAAGKIMHFSSSSAVSSEDSSMDEDVSLRSDGHEKVNFTAPSYPDSLVSLDDLIPFGSEKVEPPREKAAIQPSDDAGLEESKVSILDLPPIPEENLEDFKLEEEQRMISLDVNVLLTGSQIREESNVDSSDIEQELSFLQRKSMEETDDNDKMIRLVHEPENGDSSVVSPVVSTHDGGFTGLRLLDPTESMKPSSLSETNSDLDSNADLTDLRGEILNKVKSEKESSSQKHLNDSEEESHEVLAEVKEIKEIDEDLLSELDVVGDFHVDVFKSDQSGIETDLQSDCQFDGTGASSVIYSGTHDNISQLQVSEAMSMENADVSLNLPSEEKSNLGELHSVVDQRKVVELKVDSSLGPSVEDPELIVYNPKLHVLEASSIQDTDSVFKQLREEAEVHSFPKAVVDNPIIEEAEVGSTELKMTDPHPELAETDTELLVLEAKSIEDIDSAFNKVSTGGLDESTLLESLDDKPDLVEFEVGPSEILSGSTHMELMGIHSDLKVVEAKSLEDIHLALKQLSDGTIESTPKLMEPRDGYNAETEVSERHLKPEVLEVQSAEEIELAFKNSVSMETGSSKEQSAEEPNGVEAIADTSSSTVSTSRKSRKKEKSGKSGSGSSSSSSSSDSD